LAAAVLTIAPASALAFQDALPNEAELGLPPEFPTIEKIMDQAVRNIGVRYNLNEAQLEQTGEIMRRDVKGFLREHHDQVWPVIRDLIAAQLDGGPPADKAKVMRIGRSARPLAKLAYESIVRANEEWAEILTEEQRRLHRFDMGEMGKTFEVIDSNLRSWEQGTPGDKSVFPAPQYYPNEPARPAKPEAGLPTSKERATTTDAMVVPFDVGLFEARVDQFIAEYGLDEAQVVKARSIQRDFEARGQRHLDANKEALAEATAAKEKAKIDKNREADAQAEAKLKELRQPLLDLLAQMDARLNTLLTQQQIKQHQNKKAEPDQDKKAEPAKPAEKNADQPKSPPQTKKD
jgi:hypothetical protein